MLTALLGHDDEKKATESIKSSTKSSTTIPSSLDMLRTIDLITILANFSYSGNSARIVRDGGCGALVSLVNQFKGTNKSQNGRIACALRNLTCYLGNAQRMEKDGIIQAILELSDDSNLDVQQHCLISL